MLITRVKIILKPVNRKNSMHNYTKFSTNTHKSAKIKFCEKNELHHFPKSTTLQAIQLRHS